MALSESSMLRIAESRLEKLVSSALRQASLDIRVSHNLHKFKDSLLSLKDVLLEVDYDRQHDSELQLWVRKLKQVFYDADTVVDEIQCESLRRNQWFKDHCTSAVTKVTLFFSSSSSSQLATKINHVTKRLQHWADEKIDIDQRLLYKREITVPFVNHKDVIGREIDKEIIIEQLLMQHHHDDDNQSLSVLPIVGMGGLGKSTLSKIVFADKRIRKAFSVKMWVCVSHSLDIEEIIIEMINSACFFDNPFRFIRKGELKMTTVETPGK